MYIDPKVNYPTARKDHTCTICGNTIEKGESYKYVDTFIPASIAEDEDHIVDQQKICSECESPDFNGDLLQDLIYWCRYHGAKVQYRDYSYYVDCWQVPESYEDIETENDEFTVEYVHGKSTDPELLIEWIAENDDLPELPEFIKELA
jgi:hypothetical protein